MRTIKLNKEWSAARFGRKVIAFTQYQERTNLVNDYGRVITKRMVERLLSKRGEFWITIILASGGSVAYTGKRLAKSIIIGCQRFSLTKIKAVLSLFEKQKTK